MAERKVITDPDEIRRLLKEDGIPAHGVATIAASGCLDGWEVTRLELPAEPEIAPGTAGTATVRGVEGVRVMRSHRTGSVASEFWLSGQEVDGYLQHGDEVVTDFVPDDAPDATGVLAADIKAEVERLRAAAPVRPGDDSDRILWDGTYWYSERDVFFKQAREVHRADRATVERVEELAQEWQDADGPFSITLQDLRKVIDGPVSMADLDADVYPYDKAKEALDAAAPEPRPAFVLPEREAVLAALDGHRPVTGMRGDYSPAIVGCQCMDRVFIRGQETWEGHLTDAVLALLAEHAVTEERLAEALRFAQQTWDEDSFDESAQRVLDHLTGKAEG